MPKVVVYIRAEDARTIEAVENMSIDLWTREQIKRAIETWQGQKVKEASEWPTPENLRLGT